MESKNSENVHLVVSGGIGVGKTTFCKNISENFNNIKPFFEPVENNEYLNLFYEDKYKYSFPMQIYLLNYRFQQHQKIMNTTFSIQDRCIYEDTIFAKMLYEGVFMEKLDYETYKHLFSNMSSFLKQPDLIIYLDVKPEIALRRIKNRNRDCEKNITLEYITSLHKGYENWIKDIETKIPVLRIPWDSFIPIDEVVESINCILKNNNKNTISKKE